MNICRLNSFRSDMDRRRHNIRLFGWVRNNARGCTLPRRGLRFAFFAFDIFCGCCDCRGCFSAPACLTPLSRADSSSRGKPQQPRTAPQRRALPNPPDLLFHASPRGTDLAFCLSLGAARQKQIKQIKQHTAARGSMHASPDGNVVHPRAVIALDHRLGMSRGSRSEPTAVDMLWS